MFSFDEIKAIHVPMSLTVILCQLFENFANNLAHRLKCLQIIFALFVLLV